MRLPVRERSSVLAGSPPRRWPAVLVSVVIWLMSAGCQPAPVPATVPTPSPVAAVTQTAVTVAVVQPTYVALAPAGIPPVVGNGALAVVPAGSTTALSPVTADLGDGWVATAYVRPDARRAIAVRLQVVPAARLPEQTSDPLLAVDLQFYDATSAEPLSDRAVTLGIRPHSRFIPAQIAVFRVRDGRAELLSSSVAAEYEAVLIETTAAATLVIADRAALGQAAVPATGSGSPVAVGSPAPLLTRAPLPARISIPVIEVEAPVVPVGLEPGGNMASPTDGHLVGWFEPGPRPGEPSNAVLDGHVDWSGQPAVFWRLHELKSGDEIVVRSGLDLQFRYVVTDIQHYRAADAPLEIVFGTTPTPTLTLITCGGEFDRASRSYSDRIVVKARGV